MSLLTGRVTYTLLRSRRAAFALVVLLALVLRLAFALGYVGLNQIKHGALPWTPTDEPPVAVVDSDGYTLLAEQMISGEPYRDVIRQPLFPAFHALVFLVCGEHPSLLYNRLANVLVSGIGCGMVYLLARRMFGHTTGLVAGVLAAVNVNMIHKSGFIYSEILSLPLLLAALCFFLRFADDRQWRWLLLGGFFFGLATLVRPTTFHLFFLLPLWLWVLYGRINKRMLVRSLALVAVMLAVISPWAVHLSMANGHLAFVSARPWRLLCGCCGPAQLEQPLGRQKGLWLPVDECGLFTQAEAAALSLKDASEQERVCKQRFLEYLPSVCRQLPKLMFYRALVFVGVDSRPGIFHLYHVQQTLLFVLFLGGLWISLAQWRRLSIVYLTYFFLGVVTVLAFYGASRFRFMVDPIIISFAAAYLVHGVELYLGWKRRRAGAVPAEPLWGATPGLVPVSAEQSERGRLGSEPREEPQHHVRHDGGGEVVGDDAPAAG